MAEGENERKQPLVNHGYSRSPANPAIFPDRCIPATRNPELTVLRAEHIIFGYFISLPIPPARIGGAGRVKPSPANFRAVIRFPIERFPRLAVRFAMNSPISSKVQRTLVKALLSPAPYPHPVRRVRLLETHCSYVLLTGEFAYKIKKAVNLGFLDFGTLERRRFYCQEELRLNRRLSPDLYLAVVPISGIPGKPRVAGAGEGGEPGESIESIEYAVKMREFPQAALFDRCLFRGDLLRSRIDDLARQIAAFHARAARAGPGDEYGTPATVWRTMARNFAQLGAGLAKTGDGSPRALLDRLEEWSLGECTRLLEFLTLRRRNGFVRECHGDLHLGNIALLHGVPRVFDCLEFDPCLRWIDVMSEIAFPTMDLEERGRPDAAWRFLNRYLEITGDYAGLRGLTFYKVHRALVRANVALIRDAQAASGRGLPAASARYLAYARHAIASRPRRLLLMHGLAGSGKSTLSQTVAERIGAVRIRSDVERKRLFALPANVRAEERIYSAEATRATYRRLEELARQALDAGFSVVVDAASLQRWQREIFRELARAFDLPFRILACRADEATLRARLLARRAAPSDASDADVAVLEHQLQHSEPLTAAELRESLSFGGEPDKLDINGLLGQFETETAHEIL